MNQRNRSTDSEHEDHHTETGAMQDNDPTKTANKRRLKKRTNQEGTGGRTQTLIR